MGQKLAFAERELVQQEPVVEDPLRQFAPQPLMSGSVSGLALVGRRRAERDRRPWYPRLQALLDCDDLPPPLQ